MKKFIIGAAAIAGLAACTSTGNIERGAAIGAGSGAAAGAVIGNNIGAGDAAAGAVIGGVVGAVGGAITGHEQDKRMGESSGIRQTAHGQTLMYDASAERYYFVDSSTGRTYWQNGALRSIPPG